jgi:hypothetical protein
LGKTHQSGIVIVIVVVSRRANFHWLSAFTNHE